MENPSPSASGAPYHPTQVASAPFYPYGSDLSPVPPPPSPRTPRPPVWLLVVGALVIVALIGTIVAVVSLKSSGGGQPTPLAVNGSSPVGQVPLQSTSASTPVGQPTAIPTPTSAHKIGDTVSIDGWQMTVEGLKSSQGGEFDSLQPGDTFLEIDVSLLNQTGQAQGMESFAAFTLKDSATGQQYEQTFVSDAPARPDGRVPAGGKLRGTLAYEVPQAVHSFELDVSPNPFGNNAEVAVWTLTR